MFDQYTQYVARETRGKWVRCIRIVALVLLGMLIATELLCVYLLYEVGSEKHGDYSYAYSYYNVELTPGPWNGGHSWSREVVNAKKAELDSDFRQELWEGTTGVLAMMLVTLLVAVGCTLLLIVERRRLPHFNELM